MKCPICEVDLVMSERQGVEIDYCPKCRGVWLDRGELDKIIEKSGSEPVQAMPINNQNHNNNYRHDDHGHYKKHKKHSILGEIFDF